MYTLDLTNDEVKAIEWHDYRYCFTDLMCRKHLKYNDDNTVEMPIALKEHEAWELRDAWEDDDSTLACGAPGLVSKIQSFIDSII